MKKKTLQQILAMLLTLALVLMPQTALLAAGPELDLGQPVMCALTPDCTLTAEHDGPCETAELAVCTETSGCILMAKHEGPCEVSEQLSEGPMRLGGVSNMLTEGGLAVTGPDVRYSEGSGFTLAASGDYVISGTWNGTLTEVGNGKAVLTVPAGVNANVSLDNVTIDVSDMSHVCAFAIADEGNAHIALQGDNTLASGWSRAGLEVPQEALVTIDGPGSLSATGGDWGAGIGGIAKNGISISGNSLTANTTGSGVIAINGGTITAQGGAYSAGIGGAIGGGWTRIAITGGLVKAIGGTCGESQYVVRATGVPDGVISIGGTAVVMAEGSHAAAGIGGGSAGQAGGGAGIGGGAGVKDSGTITIDGDVWVQATGGNAAIGAGSGGNSGTINKWGGVIFEDDAGMVYGSVTISGDTEIPAGATLTIPAGATLIVPERVTLTNEGVVENNGIILNKEEGSIINEGSLVNTGHITNNGLIDSKPGASMTGSEPDGDGVLTQAITEGGLTVTGSGVRYTAGSGFALAKDGDYTVSGTWNGTLTEVGNGQVVLTVPAGVDANVTLDNVTINVSSSTDSACAFAIADGGKAHIALQGDNTLASGWARAGLEVPQKASVTIDGLGSLSATGGDWGAGIGGIAEQLISISGGSLVADRTGSGDIAINGGTITAQGGAYSAGIGGAIGGGWTRIAITGGLVKAIGGTCGESQYVVAAKGVPDGVISIGGTAVVIAEGSHAAAGIGGGSAGQAGGGAGIGGGAGVKDSGTITIDGDVWVQATGGYAAIGAGLDGNSGAINKRCGVIFEGDAGTVYGSPSLSNRLQTPTPYTVPDKTTLTIPEGSLLSIASASTLANSGVISCAGYINGYTTGNPVQLTLVQADLAAPAVGQTPAVTAVLDNHAGYRAAVDWLASQSPHSGPFDYNTAYTAKLTFTPQGQYQFDTNAVVKLNGQEITDKTLTASSLTLSHTFPATGSRPVSTYPLTVNGGTGGGQYTAGQTVTITATVPADQLFMGWVSDEVTLADPTQASTTLDMPSHHVTVTAQFQPKPADPVQPPAGGGNDDGPSDADQPAQSHYNASGPALDQGVTPAQLRQLAQADKSLTMQSDQLSLSFSPQALQAILQAMGQTVGDIIITSQKADLTPWPEAAALVGNRPVYDFTLSIRDNQGRVIPLSVDFPDGSVSLSLTYAPAKGEDPASLRLVYIAPDGGITWLDGSRYTNGEVAGAIGHFSLYGIAAIEQAPEALDRAPSFADIDGHWAEADIRWIAQHGLMTGTAPGRFDPDLIMTRGMFITTLGRLAGIDPGQYASPDYSDVPPAAYYAPYITWATTNGLAHGTASDAFSPDAPVTREQMAVLLANYARLSGQPLPQKAAPAPFADQDQISPWAQEAVQTLHASGLLRGKADNRFAPQDGASRAETAVMLKRIIEATEQI